MKTKDRIREVLRKRGEVVLAYLYGSTVKGYARGDSDLDLGILLEDGFHPDALYPARIALDIETHGHVDREIDVRIINGMPPRFLRQVIDGKLAYSRTESERVSFETSVIDRYLDFRPFYEQYDQMRRERMLGESG